MSTRVTTGFSVDEDTPAPRRVRTRSEIKEDRGRVPARVVLAELAHNPFNPRETLTDLQETEASLREKGQLVALTVVTRAAFDTAHRDREYALDDSVRWVVLDGNRRLAAAHGAGLDALRIDVNDALAANAGEVLEHALVTNLHRSAVPPLDEAKAIRDLLKIHGSQEAVARRLSKSGAWVSQRLALLELPDELQQKVETGELTVKDGRRIGRLPSQQQQHAEAAKALNRVKAPRAKKASRTAEGLNPVKATPSPAPKRDPDADRERLGSAVAELSRVTDDADLMAEALVERLPHETVVALTTSLMARL